MLIVRVPPWAATSQTFTVPVRIGNSMPAAATTAPVDLNITGFDLIWAAVLSGRPAHFLQHPNSVKNAEFAQWRVASCLRLLEPRGQHLRRPAIFHSEVDPTEKGHLNFALGGTLTMAYLANKLGLRWLAHYSLVKKSPHYRLARTAPGHVEPDYIGMDSRQQFFVAEAKGRISLDSNTKKGLNTKRQTGVVQSINGQTSLPQFGIAAITGGSKIELYATDPEVDAELPEPNEWLWMYYEYVRAVCGPEEEVVEASSGPEDWVPVSLDLPEIVSRWARSKTSDSEREESDWDWLVRRTRTQAETQSREIMPDLVAVTLRQRH